MSHRSWFQLVVFAVSLMLLTVVPVAGQSTTLEVWMTSGGQFEITQNVVAEFENRHPGVTVNVTSVSWGEYFDKVPLAFATGEAPDLLMAGGKGLYQVVMSDFGLPLNEYTDRWGQLDDYPPGVIRALTHDGKLYGLPFMGPTRLMWYRKDVFAEHGLDSEDPPETWREIRDAARRIVRFEGDEVRRIGFNIPTDIVDHALLTNGVTWYNEDLTEPAVKTPAGLEALSFWTEFGEEMNYVGSDVNVTRNLYSGEVGMIYGYVLPRQVREVDPSLFDVIGGPVVMENRVKAGYTYPDWMYITKQSRNPDLAWEFLSFFAEPDNLAQFSAELGHPAPRRGAYEHPFYQTPEGEMMMRHFIDGTLRYGTGFPLLPDPGRINQIDREVWQRLSASEWSPQAALEWMTSELNTILLRVQGE